MKKAKKLVSLLLAVVMLLSLTVSVGAAGAFADPEGSETGGKITITNATKGEKYDLYQIMFLENFEAPTGTSTDKNGNPIGGKYSYSMNSQWQGFLNYTVPGTSQKVSDKYLSISDTGVITWKETAGNTDKAYQEFAQLALKYAKDPTSGVKPVGSVVGTDTGSIVFADLPLGYYLIDTTLGSLCTLDTTNKVINVSDKNKVPSNKKEVFEDGNESWRETHIIEDEAGNKQTIIGNNDDDIGATIKFRSTISVNKGIDKLIFHDIMSDGLTLDTTSIKVSIATESGSYTEYQAIENNGAGGQIVNFVIKCGDQITEAKCDDHTEKCDIHIEFKDGIFNRINASTAIANQYHIRVEYKATLNENAVIGNDGNPNTSYVSYGNNGNYTVDSTTLTKTWGFDVLKYELGTNDAKNPLAGAKFSLHVPAAQAVSETGATTIPLGPTIKLVKVSEAENIGADGYKCAVYRVAKRKYNADGSLMVQDGGYVYDETEGITLLENVTTDASGIFRIIGLDSSAYLLNEDDSPAGYKKLANPVQVIINYDNQTATYTLLQGSDPTDRIEIKNGTGVELPSTGGIGTTIFYVVGSILLVGATILLIVKKRMNDEK